MFCHTERFFGNGLDCLRFGHYIPVSVDNPNPVSK